MKAVIFFLLLLFLVGCADNDKMPLRLENFFQISGGKAKVVSIIAASNAYPTVVLEDASGNREWCDMLPEDRGAFVVGDTVHLYPQCWHYRGSHWTFRMTRVKS